MPGKSDIRAGSAFVELTLKNSKFIKGLHNASKQLKDWGKSTAIVGAALSAAGATILAPLTAAVNQLLSLGDQFDKMRQRTGLTVEAISELDHAASQSGTTLETVEGAVAKMQKGLLAGNKGFEQLGLSIEQLQKLSPDEQFSLVAERLNGLKNPTEKAAMAMMILGKSGTQLLPMIEDLAALRSESREMGFTMSGETAAGAVKLGDMLANLTKTVRFAGIAVADVLIPPLTAGVAVMQRIAATAVRWIKDNRQLVTIIAAVGAGLLIAGAAITAFGAAMAAAGVVLGGIASALAALGTALGVILSPLGLITGALIAGAGVWAFYTESGREAVNGLMAVFGEWFKTFKTTFGGIVDALIGGKLAAAGTIAMLGLQIAFLQGVTALSSAVGGSLGDFIGSIGSQLADGNISGVWSTLVDGMWLVWSSFIESLTKAFAKAAHFLIDKWKDATGFISDAIIDLSQMLPNSVGKLILGVDPSTIDAAKTKADARGLLGQQAEGVKSSLNLDGLTQDAQARTRKAADRLVQRTEGGSDAASQRIAELQAELERQVELVRKEKEALDNNTEATKQNTQAVFLQSGQGKFSATSSAHAAVAQAGGAFGSQIQVNLLRQMVNGQGNLIQAIRRQRVINRIGP